MKYFPPNRFHRDYTRIVEIKSKNKVESYSRLKVIDSHSTSTELREIPNYLANILHELIFSNYEKNESRRFDDHPLVKEIKKQLRKLGDYDFKVEVSDSRNGKYTFEFLSNWAKKVCSSSPKNTLAPIWADR